MKLRARLLAELLGTAGLIIVVVGSGIMGETLAQGNRALALLANSIATGAGLYALILTFGHISGAHFNPALSFAEFLWKRLSATEFLTYSAAQILGALLGVLLTHLIFGLDLLQVSKHDRSEPRLLVSELIATVGLLLVIALSGKKVVWATPFAVALYITSAYWCTSSSSFANPAVTIARSLTDTFAGIAPAGVPGFIAAQFAGAVLAFVISGVFAKGEITSA